ncbi:MAG TPA: VOC family protein [Ohtaekwangia sp.]|uniref:VOC family protein n=1 Tax=Ohtaekwangia sp. TaxID=2066019 RepID=UPI002F936919
MKIPDGHQTIMPYITVEGAEKFIAFLKRVFGAKELLVVHRPEDGSVMHAEYSIGTSTVMLANATQAYKPSPIVLFIYVENIDETFHKALKAGAITIEEPANKEYGRTGGLKDEFGNIWWLVTPL